MLKIYGADLSAPSNKVRMAANYLGLEYEYQRISIRDGENRQEWFKNISPAGKVPAIDDDGFCVFESGAICKYLCVKHQSELYPQDLKERTIVEQWSDFAVIHIGGAMGRVVFNRLFAGLAKAPVDEQSLADGLKFLSRFLPVVDQQLSQNKYLVGDKLSLADITLLATLDPAEVADVDLSPYPHIVEWRKRLSAQEFYRKCHKSYKDRLDELMANR